MKRLIHWSAVIGLIGGFFLAPLPINSLQALALTQDQVEQSLRSVPVFTLTNAQGALLGVTSSANGQQPNGQQPNGQRNSSQGEVLVFISREDAQNFLNNNVRQQDANAANNVRVSFLSLAQVYQLSLRPENRNQANHLEFTFVPNEQEVQTARSLLQQGGQNAEQFRGIPLYIPTLTGSQQGEYLAVQQNGQTIIPVFFKRDELQILLDRVRRDQPSLADNIKIQVVDLLGFIQTLETENDPNLSRFVLQPPQDSIEFVRSQSQQANPNPSRPGNSAQPPASNRSQQQAPAPSSSAPGATPSRPGGAQQLVPPASQPPATAPQPTPARPTTP
jgi:nickel transport protein